MDDLISRQAVKKIAYKQIRKQNEGFMLKEQRDILFNLADKIIDALPSVQPKIVRCKDCKYRHPFIKDTATMWLPCMAIDTDDKWFCGYGE